MSFFCLSIQSMTAEVWRTKLREGDRKVVDAPSLELFKARLDRALSNVV